MKTGIEWKDETKIEPDLVLLSTSLFSCNKIYLWIFMAKRTFYWIIKLLIFVLFYANISWWVKFETLGLGTMNLNDWREKIIQYNNVLTDISAINNNWTQIRIIGPVRMRMAFRKNIANPNEESVRSLEFIYLIVIERVVDRWPTQSRMFHFSERCRISGTKFCCLIWFKTIRFLC